MMIFDFIGDLILEKIVGNFATYFLKMVRGLGLVGLKMITFSKLSFKRLSKKYKDSSKPYWMGFTILGGVIFFILIKVI